MPARRNPDLFVPQRAGFDALIAPQLDVFFVFQCAEEPEQRVRGSAGGYGTRAIGIMRKKMNPVVHFEMPAGDRTPMAKFYTNAFGWQAQMMGPEMGDYVVVTTAESEENGTPKTPGSINGGFYPKKEDWPAQYPSVVIAVDDIRESMKSVTDAGGQVLGEPMEIPGIGQYVSFNDTEGNRVNMLQPLPRQKS